MSVVRTASAFRPTPGGAVADLVLGAARADGARGTTEDAAAADTATLRVDLLEPWLCRIAVLPPGGCRQPMTWTVAPDGEMPWSGRERLSTTGFTVPPHALSDAARAVANGALRVRLDGEIGDDLALTVERRTASGWQPFLADRRVAAWRRLIARDEIHHAQARAPDARHYGLGDKSGPLDRTGRRFRCLQLDALGYDTEHGDPLYKHVPWLMPSDGTGACGLLYDTLAEITFDVGAEHSNYHEPHRVVEAREDAIVLYVVDGPRLADVVRRLAHLIGGHHFPPRRALGFGFTSMHHADAPDAQRVMEGFVAECAERRLPLSTLHMGSGYTAGTDGRRYVFRWNATRFPDRDGFFARLAARGVTACANVKPVLLTGHPEFDALAAAGAFVRRTDGAAAIEPFWGGPGAALDFTAPATRAWWTARLRERLLEPGVAAFWNDNNECEIRDADRVFANADASEATAASSGSPDSHGPSGPSGPPRTLNALDARPLQALLMTRTSFEALAAHRPDERPHVVTRAGPLGISRHAQTWSGDNRTSWHTLRWNLANGLSMSISGLPQVGHDIGGFDGPSPDAELLLRWFEMMALHPRAVMNSWKQESGVATTPWLHESIVDRVRAQLELRYRLLPLMNHLSWVASVDGLPPLRPLALAFDDPPCRDDACAFLLGDDLLVAPVVEPGATTRSQYLPAHAGGWHAWDGTVAGDAVPHEGGRVVTVDAPPGRLPLFVRDGAVLPLASAWPDTAPHDASHLTLRPFSSGTRGGETRTELMIDDGLSHRWRTRDASLLDIRLASSASAVRLEASERWTGRGRPVLATALGAADRRTLHVALPGAASDAPP